MAFFRVVVVTLVWLLSTSLDTVHANVPLPYTQQRCSYIGSSIAAGTTLDVTTGVTPACTEIVLSSLLVSGASTSVLVTLNAATLVVPPRLRVAVRITASRVENGGSIVVVLGSSTTTRVTILIDGVVFNQGALVFVGALSPNSYIRIRNCSFATNTGTTGGSSLTLPQFSSYFSSSTVALQPKVLLFDSLTLTQGSALDVVDTTMSATGCPAVYFGGSNVAVTSNSRMRFINVAASCPTTIVLLAASPFLVTGSSGVLFVACSFTSGSFRGLNLEISLTVTSKSVFAVINTTLRVTGSVPYSPLKLTAVSISLFSVLFLSNVTASSDASGEPFFFPGGFSVSGNSWVLMRRNTLRTASVNRAILSDAVTLSTSSNMVFANNVFSAPSGATWWAFTSGGWTATTSDSAFLDRCNTLNSVQTALPTPFITPPGTTSCNSCTTAVDCFTPFVNTTQGCGGGDQLVSALYVCPCYANGSGTSCLPMSVDAVPVFQYEEWANTMSLSLSAMALTMSNSHTDLNNSATPTSTHDDSASLTNSVSRPLSSSSTTVSGRYSNSKTPDDTTTTLQHHVATLSATRQSSSLYLSSGTKSLAPSLSSSLPVTSISLIKKSHSMMFASTSHPANSRSLSVSLSPSAGRLTRHSLSLSSSSSATTAQSLSQSVSASLTFASSPRSKSSTQPVEATSIKARSRVGGRSSSITNTPAWFDPSTATAPDASRSQPLITVSASPSLSFTHELLLLVSVSSVVRDTQTTVAALAVVTVGSGGGDLSAAASMVLLSVASCSSSSSSSSSSAQSAAPSVTRYLISPFWTLGSVWIAVGNLMLVAVVCGLHGAVIFVVSVATKTSFSSIATSKGRFPAFTIMAADFLVPGAVMGAVLVLADELSSAAARGVSVVVLLLACAYVVSAVLFAQLVLVPRSSWIVYCSYPTAGAWDTMLYPPGRWAPKAIRNAFGPLLGPVKRTWAVLGSVDRVIAVLLASLCGLQTNAACQPLLLVVAALSFARCVMFAVLRPLRLPMNGLVVPATSAMFAAVCALKYVDAHNAGGDSPTAVIANVRCFRRCCRCGV